MPETPKMNLFTVLMFFGIACVPDLKTICNVQFVENSDGDTFTINLPGQGHPVFTDRLPVRILGIDAAEISSTDPCELAAAQKGKEVLKRLLVTAKRLDIQLVARDKYFRLLGVPVADGLSVAQAMVDQRLAIGYDGNTKPKINWCTDPPSIKK